MGILNNIYVRLHSQIIEWVIPVFYKNIKIGRGLRVRRNVTLNCNGGELIIGKGAFINSNSSINARKLIKIGDYFLAGENVHIYDHNHIFEDQSKPIAGQGFKCLPVTIGDNVWVASNVTILGGVSIGDNCVIGANCLIYKDIPNGSVVKCSQQLLIEKR